MKAEGLSFDYAPLCALCLKSSLDGGGEDVEDGFWRRQFWPGQELESPGSKRMDPKGGKW